MMFPARWWRQREGNCSVLSSGNDEIYERCPSSFSCASVPRAVTSGHCLTLAGTWDQPGQRPMHRQHKWKVKITICVLAFAILFDCVGHLFSCVSHDMYFCEGRLNWWWAQHDWRSAAGHLCKQNLAGTIIFIYYIHVSSLPPRLLKAPWTSTQDRQTLACLVCVYVRAVMFNMWYM